MILGMGRIWRAGKNYENTNHECEAGLVIGFRAGVWIVEPGNGAYKIISTDSQVW